MTDDGSSDYLSGLITEDDVYYTLANEPCVLMRLAVRLGVDLDDGDRYARLSECVDDLLDRGRIERLKVGERWVLWAQ